MTGNSMSQATIALSMSESTDISRWGQDVARLEQTMLDVSRSLLLGGATLAYGGHIGARGYTQPLFDLVRKLKAERGAAAHERIVNYRGWPLPKLSPEQTAELADVATVVSIPRPVDVDESLSPDFVADPAFFPGDKSAAHRYAWSRGMTEMRALQSDRSRSGVGARIVLGGTFGPTVKIMEGQPPKEQWYSSRMPGVLEEVLLSMHSGQLVFLIGAFGGVAKLVIDLLQGQGHPAASWAYQSQAPFAAETRQLYAERGQRWWYYGDEAPVSGLHVDDPLPIVPFLAEMWKSRSDKGWETGINPLTREQNLELFQTADTARIVELLQVGLKGVN